MSATSPSLLIVIFFVFLFSTLGIQALFGVQHLMDFYMKNQYKNIKIIKQAYQDLRMSDICNPTKSVAKLTCNIETKTNNITLLSTQTFVHNTHTIENQTKISILKQL
jgi:hypothetical protein